MKIADILRHKGSGVVTISPGGTVTQLVASLAKGKIGALVVADGDRVVGIVSERDVVRRLNDRGSGVLDLPVSEIMTSPVISCSSGDTIDDVAKQMTERRIRHLPVIDGERLAGIVTIGDVVSSRMRQLETDRVQLEQYITG